MKESYRSASVSKSREEVAHLGDTAEADLLSLLALVLVDVLLSSLEDNLALSFSCLKR